MSHSNTEHLLDLLEDAQATLALMLTSRHIGPLRDEAAAWAIKLKEISEVLEQVRLNRVEENANNSIFLALEGIYGQDRCHLIIHSSSPLFKH